ncbi:tetratricopeptide repeat protein [Lentzea sp. CA-135723]|uniref:tetratricopeptide repeat protein n=1 Tax=Lentzea sp. CA-135723 TaxID=3239950 RepID=UPI003D8FAABC
MSDERPAPDVSNTVEDASGPVVQIGNVHGDLTVHTAALANPLPLRAGLVPPRAASFQQRNVPLAAPVTVLSGLGGVGKTQVAADHAERLWAAGEIDLLVWVTATSREAVVSGYADAAARLTTYQNPDQERGARTFLERLASIEEPWLVVLDDVQAPSDLNGLWPPASGRVVVTTRRRDAALRGDRRLVEVDVFSSEEALAYLRATLPEGLEEAAELVRDLGCLPLALAQASAYMLDRHLSCAQYRVRFAERRLAAVLPDELPDEHRTTVAATWSLSVERADALAPAGLARPLLEIASVLSPNGIPIGVFTVPPVLAALSAAGGRAVDESDAEDGLACLHRLNLVTLAASREVRVHALVQRATRDAWSDEHTRSVVTTAADAVAHVWPPWEHGTALGQVLRASAEILIAAGVDHLWAGGCHELLFCVGRSLVDSGRLEEALAYQEELYRTATDRLGSDDAGTLRARAAVVELRGEHGSPAHVVLAEHEALLEDLLRVLGPDHRDTLLCMQSMANWCGRAGDPRGAVALLEQVLAEHHRVGDSDTAGTRNNIAFWRALSGDLAGAIAAGEELLADRLRTTGPDDVETMLVRHNVADWHGGAGDPAGALAEHERLLADRVRVLGLGHAQTWSSLSTVAYWRYVSGDRAGAVAASEQLLEVQLRVLGDGSPELELTKENVAGYRLALG